MPYGLTHPNGQTRKPIRQLCLYFLHQPNFLLAMKWVSLRYVCVFVFCLQLQWSLHPVCFLPESLRGIEISDLNIGSLDVCTAAESLHDETFDAASTSHNFLTRGKNSFCIFAFHNINKCKI